MSNESGMISGLDNTMPGSGALMNPKPCAPIADGHSSADNCINPWCGQQIDSEFQIKHPGTQICRNCAKLDAHEEER